MCWGMEWHDTGILLSTRPHGEHAAILDVLTARHGRHAGVLRGGQGRKAAPMLQPGNVLSLTWRARLDAHIGAFAAELERDRAAVFLGDRLGLAGLAATTGLLSYALPERLPLPGLHQRTGQLLDVMTLTPAWPLLYLQWECALLEELGFGLSLERCAVTGATQDLVFVSPRTGRAVSRSGAGDWADRLLPLPPCLRGEGAADDAEIAQALTTLGYFLQKNLTPQWQGQPFPAARARLVDRLARSQPSAGR